MSKFRAVMLTVFLAATAGFAFAETLNMDGTQNASQFDSAEKPSRGMTQARVEASYGAPQARHDAVGDPPISRWDYPGFVVFFEYDKVVHAVSKR